jgi:hypothetical protein
MRDDAEQKRQAMHIATMLPDCREDALLVLTYVHELLAWKDGEPERPTLTLIR